MTEQISRPSAANHGPQLPRAGTRVPDGIVISPAIGPLPAVYVPQTPDALTADALLWQATARSTRLLASWLIRHLRHGHAAPNKHQTTSALPGARGLP
jgi:hypothetical protein